LPSAEAGGLKDLEAKPLPLWTLGPFHIIIFKGIKTHRGTGKAGTIIYPPAEADGKREPFLLCGRGNFLSYYICF